MSTKKTLFKGSCDGKQGSFPHTHKPALSNLNPIIIVHEHNYVLDVCLEGLVASEDE
jgi:hypothetical protein